MRLTSNHQLAAGVSTPIKHGFEPSGNGGVWQVWAPRASGMELVIQGDAGSRVVTLKQDPPHWYSGHLSNVPDGTRYFFRINGERDVPDPASRWQPDGVHQASAVFRPNHFSWTDQN